ncbi:MAG: CHAD domain-containing protein [Solirubrobacterales bacterium]
MMVPAKSESDIAPDEDFRTAAAYALEHRVDQISNLSIGLLDVTDTGPAEAMWLATRRLRAAIELFRPCFSKSQYRGGREEVRALTSAVGKRRDLDRIIEIVEAVAVEMDPAGQEGIQRLTDRLRGEQSDANRTLAQSVHGRRMQAFRVRIEDLSDVAIDDPEIDGRSDHHALEVVPERTRELVGIRLARLRASAPDALQPEAVKAQHRIRVAAERLRYALELTAEGLGSQAHTARRAARGLQEILGEIRDCDLVLPEVREQIRLFEEEDVATLIDRARGSRDLDPILVQGAPNRTFYRGHELLIVHLLTRRRMMYERFKRLWLEQSRQGVWVALESSLK